MAQIVGVINTAHSPFCYLDPEDWGAYRGKRKPYRSDVAVEDSDTTREKAIRVQNGFATLRAELLKFRPDVLIVFGNDQEELYDFNNFPALSVFVGEHFDGLPGRAGHVYDGVSRTESRQSVLGHPPLAVSLLTGLMQRGFDPGFMMNLPNGDRGMCHATMRPLGSLTDFSIPTIPLLLNVYYAPQLTALRSYEIGLTVCQLVEQYPEDLRVAVIGSGGLWHTPGEQDAYIDEEFDREGLECLAVGDIRTWAIAFDKYKVPDLDMSQDIEVRRNGITGLPSLGGPQGGTRETCNWIAAAATCAGKPWTIVDYIPIYSSPAGVAFAYCTAK